jgi:hypothetical protein
MFLDHIYQGIPAPAHIHHLGIGNVVLFDRIPARIP